MCVPVDRPTNFYTGVHMQKSEASFLVEYILANLTGTVVNVTQDDCKQQREHKDDKESRHVSRPERFKIFFLQESWKWH